MTLVNARRAIEIRRSLWFRLPGVIRLAISQFALSNE